MNSMNSMNSITRLLPAVAGLVFVLHVTPSWGGPPNPTASDGNNNTAGGSFALQNVVETPTGGFHNTGFGLDALVNTTTGDNNTAVGALAILANSTGSFNTAIGVQALGNNTVGDGNTAGGTSALVSNTTGSNNTAFGFRALRQSAGTKNIALGYKAGTNLTSGNNNIYIGHAGASSEWQTIRVGTAQTQTFIAGIATTPIVGSGATVEIDTTTGQLGVAGGSSARFKRDIAPMGTRSMGVLDLRPVTFAYRDDTRGLTHYGLVAEEVATVYPELVTHTPTGEAQTVRYQELIPMLLNELQRQRQEFQQALQSQQEALQTQAQALQRQQQELADLRTLLRQGGETASLAR